MTNSRALYLNQTPQLLFSCVLTLFFPELALCFFPHPPPPSLLFVCCPFPLFHFWVSFLFGLECGKGEVGDLRHGVPPRALSSRLDVSCADRLATNANTALSGTYKEKHTRGKKTCESNVVGDLGFWSDFGYRAIIGCLRFWYIWLDVTGLVTSDACLLVVDEGSEVCGLEGSLAVYVVKILWQGGLGSIWGCVYFVQHVCTCFWSSGFW